MKKAATKPEKPALDAPATRTAILATARVRFAHENYDQVGMQEIAADANVDAALIARYFDSKEALLSEVLADALYPSVLMDGDRATFGRRLISAFADGKPHPPELDYFLLLGRLAMVPALQPMLQTLVRDRLMLPFTAWMGGPDAALRVRIVHTILTGTSLQSLLASDSSIPPEDTQRLRAFFARIIQDLVDGESPESLMGSLAQSTGEAEKKGKLSASAPKVARAERAQASNAVETRARAASPNGSKTAVTITPRARRPRARLSE